MTKPISVICFHSSTCFSYLYSSFLSFFSIFTFWVYFLFFTDLLCDQSYLILTRNGSRSRLHVLPILSEFISTIFQLKRNMHWLKFYLRYIFNILANFLVNIHYHSFTWLVDIDMGRPLAFRVSATLFQLHSTCILYETIHSDK